MAATNVEQKKGLFDKLSQRERYQLMGLAGFLTLLAMVVVGALLQRQMSEIDQTTRSYQSALDLLATAGPAWSERAAAGEGAQTHKKVDDEILEKNSIKLTSFVAEHAEATGITVSSYDEDDLPFGNKGGGGPIMVEKQLRVEIRDAPVSNLMKLLDRIEKSTEPVFVKRLDMRKKRKSEGVVRAIITVVTYVKKPQEGG